MNKSFLIELQVSIVYQRNYEQIQPNCFNVKKERETKKKAYLQAATVIFPCLTKIVSGMYYC